MKLLSMIFMGCFSVWAEAAHVTVTFEVQLPAHFHNYRRVFISGDLEALGKWNPTAVPLFHTAGAPRGRLRGKVQVPAGRSFEFKVNLGHWSYGETSASGREIANRRINGCATDCRVPVRVENFRLKQFHPPPRTTNGRIEYLHDFYAEAFANHRSVAVYLPPGYGRTSQRYPVLYALDGDHMFDRATSSTGAEWALDEILDALIQRGDIPPVIAVGIYNTQRRTDEFLHCRDDSKNLGGGAAHYAKFLMTEVKPAVDRLYATLPNRANTALMGSSFGGSFTLFATRFLSNYVSRFAALSPGFFWDEYCMHDWLSRPYQTLPDRLWMDMGDREGWDDDVVEFRTGVRDLQVAHYLLKTVAKFPDDRLTSYVHKGGIHHEKSWRQRLPLVLKFLYAP